MKFFVVFAVVVASACAAQVEVVRPVDYNVRSSEANAPIVRASYDAAPDGSEYQHSFETGNGIVQEAVGVIKNINSEYPTHEVTGGSSYTAPDGTPIRLTYISNELGYQPSGEHIPRPPPIPELILRGLQYIIEHSIPAERLSEVAAKKQA